MPGLDETLLDPLDPIAAEATKSKPAKTVTWQHGSCELVE